MSSISRGGGAAVAVLVTSLLAPAARATDVPAGAYGDVTWTAAGSPYHLLGTVSYTGLTIAAGTTVLVPSNDVNGTRVLFTVNVLNVNGARDNPVTFQSDVDTTSYFAWQGVWAGTGAVRGAVLLHAMDGIDVKGDGTATGHMSISQTVFDSGSYAVIVDGGSVDIDAVEVKGSPGTGVWIPTTSTSVAPVHITNSVFRGLVYPISGGHAPLTIVNCTIDGGGSQAIEVDHTSAGLEVRNTLVTNGGLTIFGVTATPPPVTIVNSDFWKGSLDASLPPPSGLLSVDPRYVSATDLHLSAGSPCIDTGTAAGAPDHDFDLRPRPLGAGVDIGAYEFDPSGGTAGAGGQAGAGGAGGTGGAGAGGGVAGGGGAGAGGAGGGAAGGRGGGAGGSGGVGGSGGGSGSGGGAGTGGASGNGGGAGTGAGGNGSGGGAGSGGAGGSIGGAGSGGASGGKGGAGGGSPDAGAGHDAAVDAGQASSARHGGCGCRVVETPALDGTLWLLAIGLAVTRAPRRNRKRFRTPPGGC